MPRQDFLEFIRRSIAALPCAQPIARLSPALPRA
jgi:hypothetical protein